MTKHDDPVQYWLQRYQDTVSEHNKELTEYRKHLGNKYKPVLDQILINLTEARGLDGLGENSKGTPPQENSNTTPPSNENQKEDTPS